MEKPLVKRGPECVVPGSDGLHRIKSSIYGKCEIKMTDKTHRALIQYKDVVLPV